MRAAREGEREKKKTVSNSALMDFWEITGSQVEGNPAFTRLTLILSDSKARKRCVD